MDLLEQWGIYRFETGKHGSRIYDVENMCTIMFYDGPKHRKDLEFVLEESKRQAELIT